VLCFLCSDPTAAMEGVAGLKLKLETRSNRQPSLDGSRSTEDLILASPVDSLGLRYHGHGGPGRIRRSGMDGLASRLCVLRVHARGRRSMMSPDSFCTRDSIWGITTEPNRHLDDVHAAFTRGTVCVTPELDGR